MEVYVLLIIKLFKMFNIFNLVPIPCKVSNYQVLKANVTV